MKGLILLLILGFVFISTSFYNVKTNGPTSNKTSSEIPENVKAIIQRSCFDCHAKGSQNMYAKGKLNFDSLDELKDVKKISALKDIQQEVMSGTMPPEKYINKHPEKKITKDEKEIINKWVTKELNTIQEKVNND